jgi:hypothetical protein
MMAVGRRRIPYLETMILPGRRTKGDLNSALENGFVS